MNGKIGTENDVTQTNVASLNYMQGRNVTQNCLATTEVLMQVRLKAWHKCEKRIRG